MVQRIIKKYRALPSIVKVSFWFIFCAFFRKGISVISSPIFNRILTQEEYGLFSVYSSWNSIFSIFATLNLASGFVSVGLSNTNDAQERNRLVSSIQGLSTLVSVVFLTLFLIFHEYFEKFTSLPFIVLLFMFISYIFFNSFSLMVTKDKFNGKYLRMLLITIIFSILSPILTVAALFINGNRAVLRILVPVCVVLVYDFFCFVFNFYKGKSFFDKKIWKEALLFNLPLIPHYLASIVLSSSDRIIINDLVGLKEAGIYGFAYTISSLLSFIIEPLYTSTQPWFYKKVEQQKFGDIRKVTSIVTFILSIMVVFVMLLGPEIIFIFGSTKYIEAKTLLPTLVVGTFLSAFYIQFIQVEFKYKKTIPIMVSSVLAAGLNVGLNFWLVPIFGYQAAAYTTLICYGLYTLFHFVSQRIIVGSKIFNWPLYLVLISFVISFSFFSYFLYEFQIVRLILILIFSLLIGVLIGLAIKNKKKIKQFLKG